jgi:hypothetical protein
MWNSANLNKLFSYVCLASLINLLAISFDDRVLAETNNQKAKGGFPIRQVGGGTRGEDCGVQGQSLTALTPDNSVGMTTKALPELFFYIPKTTQAQQVEFVLRDDRDRTVYETTTKTYADRHGIFSLNIPETKQLNQLETDRNYHWYLSMICDPQNRAKDLVVEGWIKRVAITSEVSQKLDRLNPLERVNLYQKADIWYDAIATLVDLKRSQATDAQVPEKWQELLGSAGLNNIAKEPIIN